MKTNDFQENINCIREISFGQYRIILNFATTDILPFLLKDDYNYVWVHNHTTGTNHEWQEFNLPIKTNSENIKTLARSVTFDFIFTTDEFKNIMANWKGGINLIQMNHIPPHYLDLNKVMGSKRYEILEKDCDYLFEVDIPSATDYGTLISPNKEYLQSLIDNSEINWNDLP